MKTIITIQHTQSVHHTNGMVGSWTDWELSELGVSQAKRIGENLKADFAGRSCHLFLRLAAGETDSGDCRRVFRGNANIAEGIERKKSRKMLRKVSSMAAGEYGTAGKDD